MKRGFRGVPRPLFPAMLLVVAQNAGQGDQAGNQSQPSSSTVLPPPTSQPAPTESTTISPTPVTEPTSEPLSPSTAPEHEPMEHPFEQPSPEHQPSSPRQESDIPHTQAPTHIHEAEIGHLLVDDLFQLVPQLMTRIDSLEKDLKQTKQTLRNAIVKLVKKVKKMKKVVKSRRVVLTDSEDEGAKNSSKQGRNLQKDESEVFETPKQGKSLGETDISPQGLEAAETLAEVLSQIKTKRRNVKTGVRRRLDAEDVSTGFQDISTGFEEVSTGFTDIKSASEKISSGGEHVSASQREGKEKMYLEADYASENGLSKEQYMATYLKESGWMEIGSDKEVTDEELKKVSRKKKSVEELQTSNLPKKLNNQKKSDTREDVSVPKENDKESKKPKSGTEEDVEAYMEERVDEPSSEEFPMSSIPQGPAPAKIVKCYAIHCLTLEAAHIYMLTEVKYPLPSRVCQAILEKKLLGDRKDEVCYQLLKLIEKQA
ncbi:hypothetical protein Tco_0766049 [Tanacetum coccineum]